MLCAYKQQEQHCWDKCRSRAFFLLPQWWGPVIQTMWAVWLSKCLHLRPTHTQHPAQGQESTTVMWIDVHQQHPYTHFHNNSRRNNMCFLHPRKHPTHSGHPTHPHDQRVFGKARDRWEGRQNISWHAISYRSRAEAGGKRESCWNILNPSGTFFRKEIGNMRTQVFIQSSECRVLVSRP